MNRRGHYVTRFLGLCLVLLAAVGVATTRRGDPNLFPPKPSEPAVTIVVADHGIHVALILPRAEVARVAGERGLASMISVAQRFGAYDHLEFGWGDEGFYRRVVALDFGSVLTGLRALAGVNDTSVMYVGGLTGDPATAVAHSGPMRLTLSEAGFERLLTGLDAGFENEGGQPLVLGVGSSGPSLFYRGAGHYSALNVCNHWTARLLGDAGVPISPVPDTLSALLMLDLQYRAGAEPVDGLPL